MTNNKTDYNELLFDPKFRSNIRNNPAKHVSLLGYDPTGTEDIKYAVKTNTKEVFYITMLDATYLDDKDIMMLQAAGKNSIGLGTVSSAGSVSSGGTIGSTVSTLASAGTIGTAGTADV